MSKHKTKTTRKVNYFTLTINEPTPEVGSVIEHKDAIIVKKQIGDSVEVFYTDQNGKVMKATMVDKNIKTSPTENMFDFIKENIYEIKNILDNARSRIIYVDNKMEGLPLKIYLSNGRKYEVLGHQTLHIPSSNDIANITLLSKDYPNDYIKVGDGDVFGKDLPDLSINVSHYEYKQITKTTENYKLIELITEIDEELSGKVYLNEYIYNETQNYTKFVVKETGNLPLAIMGYTEDELIVKADEQILEPSQEDASTTYYEVPANTTRLNIKIKRDNL